MDNYKQAIIAIPSFGDKESLDFYKKLGFKQASKSLDIGILITDGKRYYLLSEQFNHISLIYYHPVCELKAMDLHTRGLKVIREKNRNTPYLFHLLSPEGLKIKWTNHSFFDLPSPHLSQNNIGNLAELCLTSKDRIMGMTFWKILGFSLSLNSSIYESFCLLEQGDFKIGLHETQNFKSGTLVYHDKNMPDKIDYLKSCGLKPLMNLFPHPSSGQNASACFHSPEGQPFLLVKNHTISMRVLHFPVYAGISTQPNQMNYF